MKVEKKEKKKKGHCAFKNPCASRFSPPMPDKTGEQCPHLSSIQEKKKTTDILHVWYFLRVFFYQPEARNNGLSGRKADTWQPYKEGIISTPNLYTEKCSGSYTKYSYKHRIITELFTKEAQLNAGIFFTTARLQQYLHVFPDTQLDLLHLDIGEGGGGKRVSHIWRNQCHYPRKFWWNFAFQLVKENFGCGAPKR